MRAPRKQRLRIFVRDSGMTDSVSPARYAGDPSRIRYNAGYSLNGGALGRLKNRRATVAEMAAFDAADRLWAACVALAAQSRGRRARGPALDRGLSPLEPRDRPRAICR